MLNHVTLLGRLAQTPEIKSTPNGKLVTSFDLAVSVPSKDPNTPPDWIPIVCWEKQAEFVKRYLTKGRQIIVVGRISTRKWTDNEGKNRKAVEVIATRIYFADSNNGAGEGVEEHQIRGNDSTEEHQIRRNGSGGAHQNRRTGAAEEHQIRGTGYAEPYQNCGYMEEIGYDEDLPF